MAHKYRIAAAVLIGGRSSRMGSPKQDIVIQNDGRTFLEKICDEVDDNFGECLCERYLSVRKGQQVLREGYIVVEDEYDDIGPLGGLISVLLRAASDGCDAVLLLACDMICYTAREISNICNMYEGYDILFARTEGKDIQPLASIYSVGISKEAVKQAESGDNRLRKLAEKTGNIAYYDTDIPKAYKNINSPFDQ